MKELIVKASIIEDGLIEEVKKMVEDNEELFRDETVALMADVHRGKDVPVGFAMTLSKGLVPPSFVSADIGCGMTSLLIENFIPNKYTLMTFSKIARDIIQVDKVLDNDYLNDFGTLGNGNHFVEIGTDGKDTLVTVHSGSRSLGGEIFNYHMTIAKDQHKKRMLKITKEELESVPPKERQEYIKNKKLTIKNPTIPYLDLNFYGYKKYKEDIYKAVNYARNNRKKILINVLYALKEISLKWFDIEEFKIIDCIHNYVEFLEDKKMVVRKGSISAKNGDRVIIPINMRDGIILGTSKNTEAINFSLPHGGGRVLSRTRAFAELDLETFKKDMEGIYSPTISQNTLDESPRAYKDIKTILKDIEPYLESYRVFKPVFNFKGE